MPFLLPVLCIHWCATVLQQPGRGRFPVQILVSGILTVAHPDAFDLSNIPPYWFSLEPTES